MTIKKKKREKKRQPVANLVTDYLPGNFYSEPDQNIVEDSSNMELSKMYKLVADLF